MTLGYFSSLILSNCLLCIAFIYGASIKGLWKDQQTKWYLLYLGFILFIELTIKLLIFGFEFKNTSLTYPFYVGGELLTLSQMLLFGIGGSRKWRVFAIIISYLIFFEALYLWCNDHYFSSGYGKVFSHLVIVCIISYLLITNLKKFEIPHQPLAILYAALFLYYSVSLFLFLLMDQLTRGNIVIWTMNNILASILYFSSIYTFQKLKTLR
jgi:hypothetical protein